MKKIYYLGALFFAALMPVHAQLEANFQKSEIYENDKKNSAFKSVKSDENGDLITVRASARDYFVSRYDENLKLVSEKKIEADDNSFFGLMVQNGKVHILDRKINKKSKKIEFSVFSSDIFNFDFVRTPLFSVNWDDISIGYGYLFTDKNNDMDAFGKVFFSKNDRFFAISVDYKGSGKETHRVTVLNNNLETIFDEIIALDNEDSYFELQNIQVDDVDGAIYMLGKQYENSSRDDKKEGKANYHYELAKYSPDGKLQKTSFERDELIASMAVAKNGNQLVCVGFYSEKSDNRYKGVARFNLNPKTLAVTNQSLQPFSTQFLMDKYGKKKTKELRDVQYKEIYIFENGDIIVNAEEYEERATKTRGFNANPYYIYDDIISCKMNKAGELIYARCVQKDQEIGSSEEKKYVSYSTMFDNGKNYFFFNTDKVKERDGKIEFDGHIDHLYVLAIDGTGNIDYKWLTSEKEIDVILQPNSGKAVNQNEMILVGVDGKDRRLVRIKMK